MPKASPDNFQINVTGVHELMKALDHLKKNEWHLLVKRSVNAAMKPVLKQAKRNAKTYAADTGLMWRSLQIKQARYYHKSNLIMGRIQPKSEWHTGNPRGLTKKGKARFESRAASRKTRSENAAKYAHFTELGTKRGVRPVRWLRNALHEMRQPAINAFIAKGRQLLPRAVAAARAKSHGVASTRARSRIGL